MPEPNEEGREEREELALPPPHTSDSIWGAMP